MNVALRVVLAKLYSEKSLSSATNFAIPVYSPKIDTPAIIVGQRIISMKWPLPSGPNSRDTMMACNTAVICTTMLPENIFPRSDLRNIFGVIIFS